MGNGLELEVAIVSHGAKGCSPLPALAGGHPPRGETRVTVVDSGSPDSTPDMVEREFPAVRLLRRDNIGFSAANNLVLRESEARAVPLLNPDTEVYAGTLDAGLERLWSEERIGMVGVKLVTEAGELDHACKRSFPTPLSALAHFTGIGRSAGAAGALSQYRATSSVTTRRARSTRSTAPSCSAGQRRCARSACSTRATGFMEDLDWCHRFWDAGWKVFYEPTGRRAARQGRLQRRPPRARGRKSPSTAAWPASTAASTLPSTTHS